jgi:hypothetical protein
MYVYRQAPEQHDRNLGERHTRSGQLIGNEGAGGQRIEAENLRWVILGDQDPGHSEMSFLELASILA